MAEIIVTDIEKDDIVHRWISSFASDISEEILKEHVFMDGNFLWHIFTWGKVPCLTGDQARNAYDECKCSSVYMFCNGYSTNNFPEIEKLKIADKPTSEELESKDDVYIVERNFRFTYVHTHESMCGPYFVSKN